MLDHATYQHLAQRLRDGYCTVTTLFDEIKQLPDGQIQRFRDELRQAHEVDVRIFFYRVLYRFHLNRADVRDEYVRLIRSQDSVWRKTLRTSLIDCADRIDVGDYEPAYHRLRSLLWRSNRRWKISVLFQLLRIGYTSDAHRARCLPHARSLRTLLEADLGRGYHEDRITKYALCNLFITQCHIRRFKDDTDSNLIQDATARLDEGLAALLADERTWDAC